MGFEVARQNLVPTYEHAFIKLLSSCGLADAPWLPATLPRLNLN